MKPVPTGFSGPLIWVNWPLAASFAVIVSSSAGFVQTGWPNRKTSPVGFAEEFG